MWQNKQHHDLSFVQWFIQRLVQLHSSTGNTISNQTIDFQHVLVCSHSQSIKILQVTTMDWIVCRKKKKRSWIKKKKNSLTSISLGKNEKFIVCNVYASTSNGNVVAQKKRRAFVLWRKLSQKESSYESWTFLFSIVATATQRRFVPAILLFIALIVHATTWYGCLTLITFSFKMLVRSWESEHSVWCILTSSMRFYAHLLCRRSHLCIVIFCSIFFCICFATTFKSLLAFNAIGMHATMCFNRLHSHSVRTYKIKFTFN